LINVHFDLKWNILSTPVTFEGVIIIFLRLMTGNVKFRETTRNIKLSSDTITDVYMGFPEFSLDRPTTCYKRHNRLHDLIHSQN